jgi:hypothetical protein
MAALTWFVTNAVVAVSPLGDVGDPIYRQRERERALHVTYIPGVELQFEELHTTA